MSSPIPVDGKCGERLKSICRYCLDDYKRPLRMRSDTCPHCGNETDSGGFCLKTPLSGSNRCRIHIDKDELNALILAKPESAMALRPQTGKYSKYLPSRLVDRYHTYNTDPEMLVMREEIALVDARIGDVLSRVDSGESGARWKELEDTFNMFLYARNTRDADMMAKRLEDVYRIITEGRADYQAWSEVSKLMEQRRKLVESEQKRVVTAKQIVTVDEAMKLVAGIDLIIREEIEDEDTKARIARRIMAMIRKS